MLVQDSSSSGDNVKRLDADSKSQMKEIESSIAAKQKEVGVNCLLIIEAHLYVAYAVCAAKGSTANDSPADDIAHVCLQVLDRLLGYVTNVNYTAGASHM